MPSITAEEAPRLKPFIELAEELGAFVGQVTEDPIKEVEILFDGSTATMNTQGADQRRACRPDPPAGRRRQHGLGADHGEGARHHRRRGQARQVGRLRRLHQADGEDREAGRARSPAPCFSDGKPRFIQIKGINLDAEVGQHMLYIDQYRRARHHRPARHAARRRTASTSPTSSSAATGRAATRSRCSISMRRSRRTCWSRCGRTSRSFRPSRCISTSPSACKTRLAGSPSLLSAAAVSARPARCRRAPGPGPGRGRGWKSSPSIRIDSSVPKIGTRLMNRPARLAPIRLDAADVEDLRRAARERARYRRSRPSPARRARSRFPPPEFGGHEGSEVIKRRGGRARSSGSASGWPAETAAPPCRRCRRSRRPASAHRRN